MAKLSLSQLPRVNRADKKNPRPVRSPPTQQTFRAGGHPGHHLRGRTFLGDHADTLPGVDEGGVVVLAPSRGGQLLTSLFIAGQALLASGPATGEIVLQRTATEFRRPGEPQGDVEDPRVYRVRLAGG